MCSFALGSQCLEHNSLDKYLNQVLIKRNTKLPAKGTRLFGTVLDNQQEVKIVVLEGDDPDPDCCLVLGEGFIQDIPFGLPKNSPIKVTFELTDESLIQVTAIETTYNKMCSFELRRQGKSDIDVEQARQDIVRLKVE